MKKLPLLILVTFFYSCGNNRNQADIPVTQTNTVDTTTVKNSENESPSNQTQTPQKTQQSASTQASSTYDSDWERNKKIVESVDEMIVNDLVKFRVDVNKVYVSPLLWLQADFEQKQDLTNIWALYCSIKNRDNHVAVDVYDKQSGKKLAEWGALMGFSIED